MYEPLEDCFVLPDGTSFDVSIGLNDTFEPFPDYSGFLDETRKRLVLYGRSPKIVKACASIHAEVGDDEIDVSSTPVYAAAELAVYSLYLGVKISEEDTSINPRFGNFAEDLVIVPDGYEQTYHYAQQTSNFRDMAFLDVPKLRLAIDIRPGRMSHSATNDGKASMLGSRLAWLPRNSPVRVLWEVFNLFQDINLGLIRDDKFAYLPTALGGYGKPLPFSRASNFEDIILRYKQGRHKELCRELIRRANRRFGSYRVGSFVEPDEVLSAVSRVQSSWHDWVKGKSLYSPTCWIDAPPEVHPYRVGRCGSDPAFDGVLRRLEAAGHLVAENDIAIAYEHNMLCQYLVGAETHQEFLERKESARLQWTKLSTFSLRLYGMIEPLRFEQGFQHPLTDDEVGRFFMSIKNNRFNLRLFLRMEHYYRREALDAVYIKGPMMVQMGILPRVTKMGRRYWFEQTRDSQDLSETEEEFKILLDWVLDPNRGPAPASMELVADDQFIVRKLLSWPSTKACALVTDDIALCKEIAARTHIWLCRVPVKWYYMSTYFGEGDNPWEAILTKLYPLYEWDTILDTGSVKSYEEVGFREGQPLQWPMTRPFNLMQVAWRGHARIRAGPSKVPFEEDFEWKPYRFPDTYMFVRHDLLQRRKHPVRRGRA